MSGAKQTPLVELLDRIPINQTLKVHTKNPLGFDTHNYPVSDYCHSAAAELRRQAALLEQALEALVFHRDNDMQGLSEINEFTRRRNSAIAAIREALK